MTDTLDHSREPLWVTDEEMIRRIGAPEKITRAVVKRLDETPRSGFPKKEKLYGDRRYWPAVKAYYDALYGLKIRDPSQPRRAHDAR